MLILLAQDLVAEAKPTPVAWLQAVAFSPFAPLGASG
jgi:hypothetical protein